MPSRRTVVAGGTTLATGLGLGWVVSGGLAQSGEVVRKRIDVSWMHDGERWDGYLLQTFMGSDGEIDIQYDPTYVGPAVTGPRAVTVDESLHDRLRTEFQDVGYLLGVCDPTETDECAFRMKRTSRSAFNHAQLGDEATVTDFDRLLLVHDVEDTTDWRGTAEVAQFDFDERLDKYGR
jgi:hypothetical protein